MTPEKEALSLDTSPERLTELALKSLSLGRLVARNYGAPPEVLKQLSQEPDEEIQKALVNNPNTPTNILLKLGQTYPAELFANPVFDLLLLENPNLFSEMPYTTIASLLRLPEFANTWALHILNRRQEIPILGAILRHNLSAWNQWRETQPEKKINLRGVNLEGVNLEGASLQNGNLEKANLQGCNLHHAKLQGALLKEANLQRANLKETNLQGMILQGVILEAAELQECNLQGMNLQGINLKGANLQGCNLQEAILKRADLQGANLQGANLQDTNLTWANLEEANLKTCALNSAYLEGANLKGALIAKSDLNWLKKLKGHVRGL